MSHTDLISSGINVSSLTFCFPYGGEKPDPQIVFRAITPAKGPFMIMTSSPLKGFSCIIPPLTECQAEPNSQPPWSIKLCEDWGNVEQRAETDLSVLLSQTLGLRLTGKHPMNILLYLIKQPFQHKSHDCRYLQIQSKTSLFVFLWLYVREYFPQRIFEIYSYLR